MISAEFQPPIKTIQDELGQLSVALKDKALQFGLRKAIIPIRDYMKNAAPYKYGALRESIGYNKITALQKAKMDIREDVAYLVGPNRKVFDKGYRGGKKISQVFKAIFMERGVDPHSNVKDAGLVGATPKPGIGLHPGHVGKYFMHRARLQGQVGFEDRFYSGLSSYLDRQRKKK